MTQTLRTTRAPGTMPPPLPSTGTCHTGRQVRKPTALEFNFILFFHTGSKGWSDPTLTPLALTVPRILRPQIVGTYSQGRKKAWLLVC